MDIEIKRPKLKLTWHAYFNDNTHIDQYNVVTNTENPFQTVLDKFDKLVLFELTHLYKPLTIKVDVLNGNILINNSTFILNKYPKHNIRLIYFRRNKVDIDVKGEAFNHRVFYFIGYQYNTSKGENRKVILVVDQEGNMSIGDDHDF